MTSAFHHQPVMADRIVELFRPVPPGGPGRRHDRWCRARPALLEARPDLRLLGIDQDTEALAAAAERLAPFGDRVTLRHARFDRLGAIMSDLELDTASGVLFDLGVSLPPARRARARLLLPHRRPARHADGPGPDVGRGRRRQRLPGARPGRVLREYGDERFADRIARAIVATRPIETTAELAAIVRDAIPAPARRRGGHPAKRTFQAIRIAVNRELEVLPDAIDDAIAPTSPVGVSRCLATTPARTGS